MSELNAITSIEKNPDRKRVGRGNSAGGGTTAGRGTKGQKARTGGNVPARFEGGQTPYFRRIAKKKGFRHHRKFVIMRLNLNDLSTLTKDGKLTLASLIESKILRPDTKLKLLGEGELSTAYDLEAHYVSAGAREKIEKAGGKITLVK